MRFPRIWKHTGSNAVKYFSFVFIYFIFLTSSEPVQALKKSDKPLIAQAWSQYQSAQYAHAAAAFYNLLMKDLKDSNIKDLLAYYASLSAYEASQQLINQSKATTALQLTSNYRKLLIPILTGEYEFTPLKRKADLLLAKISLLRAQAYLLVKNQSMAQKAYFQGLSRLDDSGSLNLIEMTYLEDIQKICISVGSLDPKATSSVSVACEKWLWSLASSYSTNNIEFKKIREWFPKVFEKKRPDYSAGKGKEYSPVEDVEDKKFQEAFAHYLNKKYDLATQLMQQHLVGSTKRGMSVRLKYWLGMLFEIQSEKTKSVEFFEQVYQESPLSYYGLLSAKMLKKDLNERFQETWPSSSSQDSFTSPRDLFSLSRVEWLQAHQVLEMGKDDLKNITFKRDSAPSSFFAYLAEKWIALNENRQLFVLLQEWMERKDGQFYKKEIPDYIFPTPHLNSIQNLAAAQKVEPLLILSLSKQESAFDVDAISRSGAMGLMQLMPKTASYIEPQIQRLQVLLPENNIRLGSQYIATQMKQFCQSAALALAAYNAGPERVKSWVNQDKIAQYGFQEFIELIPYSETKDYVASIYRNYVWYQSKLNKKEILNADIFWSGNRMDLNCSAQKVEGEISAMNSGSRHFFDSLLSPFKSWH